MDLPALVERHLEDEQPRSTLALGEEDLAVFTPTRTLIYRAESLLRDAAVEEYSHDVERLSASGGRRKTTFTLEFMTGTERFSVPRSRAEAVLEQLLRGILEVADVTGAEESMRGVYRFSDLTIVVTDERLVKHIGTAIWDGDYDAFPFERVTGLTFEKGRVATQVVLRVDGRSERIKVPNDEAPLLRQTLTEAVLEFYDTDSIEAFNDRPGAAPETRSSVSSLALDDSLSPLIASDEPGSENQIEQPQSPDRESFDATPGSSLDTPADSIDGRAADVESLTQQIADLRRAIEQQNEIIERQSLRIADLERRLDAQKQE